MLKVIAAALAIVTSFAAFGAEMSAGDLYGFCVSTDAIVQNVCSKYILGAAQGMSLAAGKLGDKTIFCIPDDIAESRLVDVFIRTARADFAAYPRDKNVSAISLLGAILTRAFPCHL